MQRARKILLLCLFTVLLNLALYEIIHRKKPHHSKPRSPERNTMSTHSSNSTKLKRIIFWNKFYGSNYSLLFKPHEKSLFKQCRKGLCEFSRDVSSNPLDYDALVVLTTDKRTFPKVRLASQIYVGFVVESPLHRGYIEKGNFYNMSMLPNRGATAQLKNNVIERKVGQNSSGLSKSEIFKRYKHHEKDGSEPIVLWIVSNCHATNRRQKYISKMKEHIKVDIHGRCGKRCPSSLKGEKCINYLTRNGQYKFYLAFENSACRDYISEKAYRALNAGLVPVVLGGLSSSDYSRPGVMPPNSYIDVRNFTSPRRLAEYLKMLDQNDELYMAYHAWRTEYTIRSEFTWLCSLCDALHQVEPNSSRTIDLEQMYHPKKQCDRSLVEKLLTQETFAQAHQHSTPRAGLHHTTPGSKAKHSTSGLQKSTKH